MARLSAEDDNDEVLDVLDLPQLYQKPAPQTLLSILADLSIAPPSWDGQPQEKRRKINSEGIPAYLTKIVSSSLSWIEDDEQREQIWELASQRLSERSGRSGMGAMTRTFSIPLRFASQKSESTSAGDSAPQTLEIILHEPALTADNLGLKTWASSYLLAKRLAKLQSSLPTLPPNAQILELGAGTGLVGLAAAAVFKAHVILTDLPDIVSNLTRNVSANAAALAALGVSASTAVLDWVDPSNLTLASQQRILAASFPLILAADPIYSADHPRLLVQAIVQHLSTGRNARVVVELPLREAFADERRDLRERLGGAGLEVVEEGEDVGFDDWGAGGGGEGLAEVRCWWSVWGWG